MIGTTTSWQATRTVRDISRSEHLLHAAFRRLRRRPFPELGAAEEATAIVDGWDRIDDGPPADATAVIDPAELKLANPRSEVSFIPAATAPFHVYG